ncbi:succinate dehydrogenase/fumarate reductase iron-sulfur subunit [Pelagibius sp. Alg239-R121]|uniref:succinate dehydrogenase/fumarate reductase iron-sulfur subunit n=1 Tax=Pelagibius sp. Alg239-R121 TaxID=2993448 RepID=UPI0024A75495|nr:succinate dehydrogenase/fumarate reductase iron-sulfur subunit [Pelagibius sp. Alg239-R121]
MSNIRDMPNGQTMEVRVWRSDGEGGRFEGFDVPQRESQTILDVVSWIQQNADSTLSYRFACRVGMCGSCAMMVNGQPRWTCRTHVKKVLKNNRLTVEPLRNLPVIKDLVADMDPFFDKWVKAEGVFHPSKTRADAIEAISSEHPMRVEADRAIECINCAVCYAACDVVEANPDYLGPAALNRAWTLMNDERDAGHDVRLDAVSQKGGCHNCHSQQSCVRFCPNELNPTASIAGLKRETAKSFFRRRD